MRIIARLDIKNEFVIKGINLEGLRKIGDPIKIAQNYYNQGIDVHDDNYFTAIGY